jgi:hypothetical protein
VSGDRSAPSPSDEWRHVAPPEGDPTFVETWTFVAGPGVDRPAVEVELGDRPALGSGWFRARVTGPGDRIVVLADLELPRVGPTTFELRASGLWADHVVEEPLRRWSLGLEAFGVALPLSEVAGTDLLDPDLRGDRVAVGWDLEWEHLAAAEWLPGRPGTAGYSAPCHVHGEVLVGDERYQLDVAGHRAHRWGPGTGEVARP